MSSTNPQNPYTIHEQHLQGKRSDVQCEDLICITPNFIAVLDGVTSKDKKAYNGTTGGHFAALNIAETIKTLPADIHYREAVNLITENLATAIKACYPEQDTILNPPGSQLGMYSVHRREIWNIGDIHVRIDKETQPLYAPPTDAIATNFRAAVLHAHIKEGKTVEELRDNDPSWELMHPLLLRQDLFANQPIPHYLSYGIVNGTHIPDFYIYTYSIPAGSEIVLASDGYLGPEGTLEEAEQQLARTLEKDPLLINKHKGFRAAPNGGSFDDRAWIRFTAH